MLRVILLLLSLGAVGLSGCGTLDNLLSWNDCRVYGGTASNLDTVSRHRELQALVERPAAGPSLTESQQLEKSIAEGGMVHSYASWAFFAKLDLPLTLVGDTVTLPYTLLNAVGRPVAAFAEGFAEPEPPKPPLDVE
ncbi:hypothetical protein LzC2_29190 [Planctomycetes bacterium LzC2]|uniref:Uncharacterized protein n=2 Tax=Alienimonas chondri TaxID=2681879 RepID=A0ABX1VGD4_9PLAN|nr:hypothetical protein [Alienimonas chondri]